MSDGRGKGKGGGAGGVSVICVGVVGLEALPCCRKRKVHTTDYYCVVIWKIRSGRSVVVEPRHSDSDTMQPELNTCQPRFQFEIENKTKMPKVGLYNEEIKVISSSSADAQVINIYSVCNGIFIYPRLLQLLFVCSGLLARQHVNLKWSLTSNNTSSIPGYLLTYFLDL